MIRLALRVRPDRAELVLAELIDLFPNGVEETVHEEAVEFAVYGAPGELPELPALRAAAGDALVDVETTRISDDWFDGWRRFHRPVVVAGRLMVRPPWADPPADPEVLDVVIDPGQAFGTGAHDSTRLCLELMLELEPAGSFADLGCGSAVLAIAAAGLGFAPVVALDDQPESVEAARGNAGRNGAELEVRGWDLRKEEPPAAGTVAANLLRPLLLQLAGVVSPETKRLVAGGLLAAEADEVGAAFTGRGLRERERRHAGDWAALLLERD